MTHKQKVLRLLSDREPHTHMELYALGCVAHSRISDLRRDGHQIDAWRDGDLYLYRLVGVLDEAPIGPVLSRDPLLSLPADPPGETMGASSSTPTLFDEVAA